MPIVTLFVQWLSIAIVIIKENDNKSVNSMDKLMDRSACILCNNASSS